MCLFGSVVCIGFDHRTKKQVGGTGIEGGLPELGRSRGGGVGAGAKRGWSGGRG